MLHSVLYSALVAAVAVHASPLSIRSKSSWNPFPDRKLIFKKDGSFKLAVFTDLHLGWANSTGPTPWEDYTPERDNKVVENMQTILKDQSPDFISYLGDVVHGEDLSWSNATDYCNVMFGPAKDHNVPFAATYGNHDNAFNISHTQIYYHEKEYFSELSYTQKNRESAKELNGQYNYYIPVYASKDSDVPAMLLWFFDSRSGTYTSTWAGLPRLGAASQDWIDSKASEWIKETTQGMKDTFGTLPPSMVFTHIPPTFAAVIQNETVSKTPDSYGPALEKSSGQGTAYGAFWNNTEIDHPWYEAVKEHIAGEDGNGLLAVVSGHNHRNNWCARTEASGPVTFCYARHTGTSYGELEKGSRIFEIALNGKQLGKVQSYVSLIDHTVANYTTLYENDKSVVINKITL